MRKISWSILLMCSIASWAQADVDHSAYFLAKDIDQLQVDGPMMLRIRPQSNDDHMHVTVAKPKRASLVIQGHTLHLHTRSFTPITIHVAHLENLLAQGGATIHVRDVDLHRIYASHHQDRPITLVGVQGLEHIVNMGSGALNVNFIQADHLALTLGHQSVTKLSGLSERMVARLSDEALLDATFMRSNRIWLHGKDFSIAKINPRVFLHAYGEGKSQVAYFHRLPNGQAYRHTQGFANIMYVIPDQEANT